MLLGYDSFALGFAFISPAMGSCRFECVEVRTHDVCVSAALACTLWIVNKHKATSSLISCLVGTWKYIIQFGKQDTF